MAQLDVAVDSEIHYPSIIDGLVDDIEVGIERSAHGDIGVELDAIVEELAFNLSAHEAVALYESGIDMGLDEWMPYAGDRSFESNIQAMVYSAIRRDVIGELNVRGYEY